jgi:hypothetical protein
MRDLDREDIVKVLLGGGLLLLGTLSLVLALIGRLEPLWFYLGLPILLIVVGILLIAQKIIF